MFQEKNYKIIQTTSQRRGLNPRPSAYEADALPLSYIGVRTTSQANKVKADVIYVSKKTFRVVPRGLEPRTLWLLAIRSNQLSYETNGKYIWPLLIHED